MLRHQLLKVQHHSFWKKIYLKVELIAAYISENVESYNIAIFLNATDEDYLCAVLATLSLKRRAILLDRDQGQQNIDYAKKQCPWGAMIDEELIQEILEFQEGDNFLSQEDILTEKKGSLVIFTSGSSGGRKGVEIEEDAIESACDSFLHFYGSADTYNPLPQFHIGGLMASFRCLYSKAILYWHLPKDFNAIRTSMVPTQLFRLLQTKIGIQQAKEYEMILLGGAPVSKQLWESIQKHSIKAYPSYGLTESVAACAAQSSKHYSDKPNEAFIMPNRDIIIDKQTKEIILKGKALFSGYWKDGHFFDCADADGQRVLRTQDLGSIEKCNLNQEKLSFIGRKDLVFQSGGENINPYELEELITRNSNFDECFIIGVPDKEWGNIICAFVHEDQIHNDRSFLDQFAPFQRPKYWFTLPRNQGLKVERALLKSKAILYLKELDS